MKLETLKAVVGTGRFATVDFITRSGRTRTLNGRTGVTKHLKGGTRKYNPAKKGLLTIFDRKIGKYRSIACENVLAIRADGIELKVRNR